MKYKRVSFDDVKQLISAIFPDKSLSKWDIIPNDILELAQRSHAQIETQKIDWWKDFEYGHIKVVDSDFHELLFVQMHKSSTEKVIIITDECFKDLSAYCITFSDITNFSESIYPEIHQMDFFQPLDILFIFPEQNKIIILNHEGFISRLLN